VTSQGAAHDRFRRAIARDDIRAAEAAARELGFLSLPNALELVILYAEQDSPKFERAAVRWLARLALERDELRLSDALLAASSLVVLRTAEREPASGTLVGLAQGRRPTWAGPSEARGSVRPGP
jgi:hypothetical protein